MDQRWERVHAESLPVDVGWRNLLRLRRLRAESCSELVSGRPLGTFEDDSDDGLVGDKAKRRPAAAARVRPHP